MRKLKSNRDAVRTYRALRRSVGFLTLIFPFVLIGIGFWWGIEIQPSLSDYYFAEAPVSGRADQTPVRLWFVGFLFIVGWFLWRYEGFSDWENYWLSVAGLAVTGVAIFPMTHCGVNDWGTLGPFSPHGFAAVLAFSAILIVILFFSEETLRLMEVTRNGKVRATRYRTIYRLIGASMAGGIGTSMALHFSPGSGEKSYGIIIAETIGLLSFAAYWYTKNQELADGVIERAFVDAEKDRHEQERTHGSSSESQ